MKKRAQSLLILSGLFFIILTIGYLVYTSTAASNIEIVYRYQLLIDEILNSIELKLDESGIVVQEKPVSGLPLRILIDFDTSQRGAWKYSIVGHADKLDLNTKEIQITTGTARKFSFFLPEDVFYRLRNSTFCYPGDIVQIYWTDTRFVGEIILGESVSLDSALNIFPESVDSIEVLFSNPICERYRKS